MYGGKIFMKMILFSILFLILFLTGCTTPVDPFQESLLYSYKLDFYNTGTTCENPTSITYINNFEISKKHQTHTDYEETFFIDNSVIYVTDILASSSSIINIESLFNYEDTTLLFYSEYSVLPSGQCYDFEIEVEGKLLNPEIEIHKSRPNHFKSLDSENQFIIFFLEETNYLIYQDSNQYSISTFEDTNIDNKTIIEHFKIHLDDVDIIEIEYTNSEITFEFNEETFELIE